MLWLSIPASAYDFCVNGMYYDITDANKQTVAVTYETKSYNSYSGKIIVPSAIQHNRQTYSVTSIGRRAFKGCPGLTAVTIPNSVTSIGSDAFYGCSGLTSVCIPNSVTSIGSYAFYGCSRLTSVCIPNAVTSIGDAAFRECSGLTMVTIPNSVTSIRDDTFNECKNLISVSIPNSVTSIGRCAFYGCSKLTSATIPNSIASIGHSAFYGCGLTSVTIPSSVTSIENYAFRTLDIMKEFTIEEGDLPLVLGTEVFAASNLFIGRNWTCNGTLSISTLIKKATLGKKVTQLPNNAFKGCISLTSVTIPNSVISIGNNAFDGCDNLTEVKSYIMKPFTVYSDVFMATTYNSCILRVPTGTKELYQTTDAWSLFSNIIEDVTLSVEDAAAGEWEADALVTVYNLSGTLLMRNCTRQEAMTLPRGFYILVSGDKRTKIKI